MNEILLDDNNWQLQGLGYSQQLAGEGTSFSLVSRSTHQVLEVPQRLLHLDLRSGRFRYRFSKPNTG